MKYEDMQILDIITLIIGLIGFFMAFFVQFRLKHNVSREKIIAIEDVSTLWKNSIPPKEVLNEIGLYFYKVFKIGGLIFVLSILTMMVRAQHLNG